MLAGKLLAFFFFFNDTATTEIYTLSLHDALPICGLGPGHRRDLVRALLSVSDKRGLVAFARDLAGLGWEIVSTGGTAETLRQAGLPVIPIERVTGFPEMMDGRVKTLHPKVHGGLLARRAHAGDRAAPAEHGITPIDLVAVNLYPFRETVAKLGVTFEQ